MTAVGTPTTQSKMEWGRIFNKTFTENCTSSATFMKQLTAIAISMVTYLKDIFPDESFKSETFAGIKLRILKNKCRDDHANFVSTTLQQAFDAFDKKYLQQLALCFYEGDNEVDNLIEYYIFDYKYSDDTVSMTVQSKSRDAASSSQYSFENVRKQTISLLKSCMVLMQAHSLPPTVGVSFRLYYNENAPEGYQAPGFEPSAECEDALQARLGDTVKLGAVETRYHKLSFRSYMKDYWKDSHEAIPSQNPPAMTQMEDDLNESNHGTSQSPYPTRCPCNNYSTASDIPLLLCMYCKSKQHAVCFGIGGEWAGAARHCCERCAGPARAATDPRLAHLDAHRRQSLCMFRRALAWVAGGGEAGAARLAAALALSRHSADKLMRLLHALGVLRHDLGSTNKIVPERLKVVLADYFQTEKGTIVDRLMAESFEKEPDPIGEVLSPIEKISLQTTSISHVVNAPNIVPPAALDDSTLNMYKQAILTNERTEEELPLSGSHNPVEDVHKLGKKLNKRKLNTDKKDENIPVLRSGIRSKRLKTKAK